MATGQRSPFRSADSSEHNRQLAPGVRALPDNDVVTSSSQLLVLIVPVVLLVCAGWVYGDARQHQRMHEPVAVTIGN